MSNPSPTSPFPPDLRARLQAAGVTDEASMRSVFARDPQLRADFETFIRANPARFATQPIDALLSAFVQVGDEEQMIEFWRTVPSELEAPFLTAAESSEQQLAQAGDDDRAELLRERIVGFRQVQARQQFHALLSAFKQAETTEQMIEVWRSVPSALEAPLLEAAESIGQQAAQAGDHAVAQLWHERIAGFRQVQAMQHDTNDA